VNTEKGLTLMEIAEGYTKDDIIKSTGCSINVNRKNSFSINFVG
jgi:acyl CoA:acetate/3-ketoacid CoA transferase beta subunit